MSSIFTAYLHQARTVVLYRLPATIRPCSYFPLATTVAVIDCEPDAVHRMLARHQFPRLQHVHYLSGHPGRIDLYQGLPECKWVFPNQDYGFYQCMVDAGWGRVDRRLIPTYIDRVHGAGMDLRLPGLGVYPGVSGYVNEARSLVTGYHWHLMEYIHTPYRPIQGVLADAFEELHTETQDTWRETRLEKEVMEAILREKK